MSDQFWGRSASPGRECYRPPYGGDTWCLTFRQPDNPVLSIVPGRGYLPTTFRDIEGVACHCFIVRNVTFGACRRRVERKVGLSGVR
jgi:hypothetical protein